MCNLSLIRSYHLLAEVESVPHHEVFSFGVPPLRPQLSSGRCYDSIGPRGEPWVCIRSPASERYRCGDKDPEGDHNQATFECPRMANARYGLSPEERLGQCHSCVGKILRA